jgi:uncharacterized protein (DUF952 family)
MTTIYHITTRDAALAARESGEYRAESLSGEGFIHFSGPHQLLGVAHKFYAGRHGLVLLVVDVSRLKAELKYESPLHPGASTSAAETDELFPHLYGPLNFDAVVAVHDFEPDANGRFSLPAALRVSNF